MSIVVSDNQKVKTYKQYSYNEACDLGLFSRSKWKEQDVSIPADAVPAGFVVRESVRSKYPPPCGQPLISHIDGIYTYASDSFDVFARPSVSVSGSVSPNSETVFPSSSCASSPVSSLYLKEKEEEGVQDQPHYDPREVGSSRGKRTCSKTRNHSLITVRTYVSEAIDIAESDPHRHDILRFVDLIYRQRIMAHKSAEDFLPLKWDYLDNQFSKQFGKLWAVASKYVERDSYYLTGSKSYGYRLREKYRTTHRLREITIPKPKKQTRKLETVEQWLSDNLSQFTVDAESFARFSDWQNYEVYAPLVQMMKDNEWGCSVDEFGHRFHSVLTRLWKPLRSVLRHSEQNLVEIDVRNSQPVFLALELQERGIECAAYRAAVEQGTLYDSLAVSLEISRNEAKEELLKVFYSKNGYRSKLKRLFRERYPTVAEFIEQAKERDHKRLARIMQRAESKFMLHRVCRRIMQDKGCAVATIHDSLLVPVSEAHYVRQIMLEEFAKLGITPTLKEISYDEQWREELFARRERLLWVYKEVA